MRFLGRINPVVPISESASLKVSQGATEKTRNRHGKSLNGNEAMENRANIKDIKEFFEGWELYTSVIENNYMIHLEVVGYLHKRLSQLGWSDLSLFEVGCGDAYVASEIAKGINVERYCGIELSRMALQFASDRLMSNVEDVTLINGDMMEETRSVKGRFDVILAGYTLHHLDWEGKKTLMSQLKKLLYPGGLLIVYDEIHEPDETPKAYLERSLNHFDANWRAFSEEQLSSIRKHVSENDLPESWEGWQRAATESGFTQRRLAYRDPSQIFGIMEFGTLANPRMALKD